MMTVWPKSVVLLVPEFWGCFSKIEPPGIATNQKKPCWIQIGASQTFAVVRVPQEQFWATNLDLCSPWSLVELQILTTAWTGCGLSRTTDFTKTWRNAIMIRPTISNEANHELLQEQGSEHVEESTSKKSRDGSEESPTDDHRAPEILSCSSVVH